MFGKYGPDHEFVPSVRKWMEDRKEVVCPACGEKWWKITYASPVCHACWAEVPSKGKHWWWSSHKSKRSLKRLIEAYFPEAA